MKIHKKDKQQQQQQLAATSPESKSGGGQSLLPALPRGHVLVGPKEQLRVLAPVGGASNHRKAPPALLVAASPLPRPPPSEEDDDDEAGGGGRVRKKRKKKEKRAAEDDHGGGAAGEGAKKRKAGRAALGHNKKRKSKAGALAAALAAAAAESGPQIPHGPKNAERPVKVPGKRGRKPKIKILPPLPPPQGGLASASPPKNLNPSGVKPAAHTTPKQRGRKARDPGAAPVERKKKAKRRKVAAVAAVAVIPQRRESDDDAAASSSPSVNTGKEDSQDPLDNAKRRSGRQVKRRKYNEDSDLKVVDDDGETIAVLGAGRIAALNATALAWQAEEPPEDEANIIEKILSVRAIKKETSSSSEDQAEETEEFFVKYRNFSYMHCKWATLGELEKDPRIHQKIKRFRTKRAQTKHLFSEPDEDLFNPDYVEVDRVLEVAVTTDTETGEEVTHYLVKWCSLSYEEATWELQEDLDPEKIKDFEEIQKPPPDPRHVERPSPDKWQKLERSRDYRNGNQLREYQLEGMNWLLFNWYNRKNCILADEMGLGKTIQSITFLHEMFGMGVRGPFLIIAPLSTITNWEREFRTWTRMNVVVYHGSQISRQMILQYEMFHRDAQGNAGVLKFHGLITTFEMVMADCPDLKKLQWRCVVIDEAHRLKNRNCKLLEGLKLMNLEHKVLLTGTPLQNSVEELFSLLNFLEPLQFPSESAFLQEFGDLKTEEQVKKLQAILKPMMLRRLKDDVEKNLAPKEETIIEVELTNMQKKYYRAILEKNFSFLSRGANQHNMPNLINTMMELRKCCNHPYLITGAEEKILESFRKSHSPDASDLQLQAMIQAAGKLVLIDKLLPKLLSGGHKVLVFSQMVRCLDILEDYLIQKRYAYERIDGRVRGNLRQAAIDRFCKPDSDRFVFLLCTRAGGLGINLTAADTCIIFDSDWNPQNDLQAQARCHRIGQSKAVKVYRLITRNSYEREMFDKASLKLGLDKAVLQDINRKGGLNGVQQLSKLELEELLKKGAYGALMDEEDEGSKFCEEDIDQILQRRTQTITIETEGKGSTFAKASFVSSGNRTDISLDDPNFWQKWAKIAEVEIDSKSEKESLVIDTPRVRKQTRHYNSFEDDELMEFSELDSDSEEKPCRGRRPGGRRYLRAECFRVEKNLLIFGWGRWKDILNHGRFKWHLAERDMEAICRALLVYCLKHYKGDDKIKSFIWDLISPSKEGQDQDQELLNHSGLSAPVPRGRKGNKIKSPLSPPELKNVDWLAHCNPEVVLQDDSYKKHLKQHCNKVLLRVRMLYYLKVEVLGEAANQALEDTPASQLDVAMPDIDYVEIPASWWDAEADKSLLVGVHKHGYERYNAMRADAHLCFLERVGMPDVAALTAEQGGGEGAVATAPAAADVHSAVVKEEDLGGEAGDVKNQGGAEPDDKTQGDDNGDRPDGGDGNGGDGATPERGASPGADGRAGDATLITAPSTAWSGTGVAALQLVQARPLWPAGPALTARLRRLIAAYQRLALRREALPRPDFLLHEGAALGPRAEGALAWQLGEELRRCAVAAGHAQSDALFLEWQRRWTRREQMDFYRTVSSFGVAYDPDGKRFDWSQFRVLARLERKTDDSLQSYFNSFVNMCRSACKLPLRKEEGSTDGGVIPVDPLSEERAARTLYRIELLRKIREQVLRHPLLSARLQLCRPSLYLPVWWESGRHDRDLLVGAARHGLSRTDFYILNDPQLGFLEARRNYVRGHHVSHLHRLPPPHCCLSYPAPPPEYPRTCPPHGRPGPGSPVTLSRGDFLDCPPLDESLGDLEALHGGKAPKDAPNGFPFNSAAGGRSMLNSYAGGGGGTIAGRELRGDALAAGERGSSREAGLLPPSVELDRLQATWDGTDHPGPARHMFNASDPVLGPTGFLEEEEEEEEGEEEEDEDEEAPAGEDATLEECLGLPPSSSPSHPSAGFMLFKDIDGGVDPGDLAASPLPPYMAPLSPPDASEEVGAGEDAFRFRGRDGSGKDDVLLEDRCRPHQAVEASLPLDMAQVGPPVDPLCPDLMCPMDEVDTLMFGEEDEDDLLTGGGGGGRPQVDRLTGPHPPAGEEAEEKAEEKAEPEPGAKEEPRPPVEDEGEPQDEMEEKAEPVTGPEVEEKMETREPPSSAPEETEGSPAGGEVLRPTEEGPVARDFLEVAHAQVKGRPTEEESSSSPAGVPAEDYSCSPRLSLPFSLEVHEAREPTIAQLLQEKALYSYSDWPKDRIIINRLDSICQAVLKGKWPSSGEGYQQSAQRQQQQQQQQQQQLQRSAFLPAPPPLPSPTFPILPSPLAGLPKYSGRGIGGGIGGRGGRAAWRLTSLPLLQERLVAPPFPPEPKRPFDYEAAGEVEPGPGGEAEHAAPGEVTPPPSPARAPSAPDVAGILQAGLIHPVTGQIVNGGDDALRRRRGRRRNAEALYSEFAKGPAPQLPDGVRVGAEAPGRSLSSLSSSSSELPAVAAPLPDPAAVAAAMGGKGLMEWLRHKPGYGLDLPFAHVGAGVLHGLVKRPKQRRHRCKDPTKLDVNALTGDERVPVVHRGTGRRLGGAMAPAIKELSRWLDANSEYFVAADWAEVVKRSGFLPEAKFSRILSEDVHRDPSSRRRGRRPRGEMPKPLPSEPPIFANGADSALAARMAGAVPMMAAGFPAVFPPGDEAENGLGVLPVVLRGVPPTQRCAPLPGHALFGVVPLHAPSPGTAPETAGGGGGGGGKCRPGAHLTFNPFLIPGMSHGLLYPHVFLPPPAAAAAGSPKRRRRREEAEGPPSEGADSDGRRSTATPPEDLQKED
ncbi:chromodomain-helicase-DNA-binding protein 6 isoform X2 [Stigmatopora nigra]